MQLEMKYYTPSAVGMMLGFTKQAGHMMVKRGELDGIRGIGADGIERVYLIPESEVQRELARRGLPGNLDALKPASQRRNMKRAG